MKVVRIYHGGLNPSHRQRERALARAGVHVTLIAPTAWPGDVASIAPESFDVVRLPVVRPGDVNRHRFADAAALGAVLSRLQPDVVDLHEETFSSVVHQALRVLPPDQATVAYAAQNLDKRFPPPFWQRERHALARLQGAYPCSRQAASVLIRKGFAGEIRVLPLGVPADITPGRQALPSETVHLLLVGRLVPEKGVLDAVRAVADARRLVNATLTIVGDGPERSTALRLAAELGISHAVVVEPWLSVPELTRRYRRTHFLLAPSRTTRTWVEQFGRMVTEAQTAGAVVVGYATGSLPEVVGDSGVLVDDGDVAGLATAVMHLVSNPAEWNRLRDRGLAASPSRTWDAVAAGQVELYAQAHAVSGARPPRTVRRCRDGVAIHRFGDPAEVSGGGRPFALPVLRQDTSASRLLARVIDRASRAQVAGTVRRP